MRMEIKLQAFTGSTPIHRFIGTDNKFIELSRLWLTGRIYPIRGSYFCKLLVLFLEEFARSLKPHTPRLLYSYGAVL